MNQRRASLLLAAVILTRSTSYLFTKTALQELSTLNLLAARFLTAFLFLFLLFRKRWKGVTVSCLWKGGILGVVFFLVMYFELTALKTTPTATTSFLENTAILFVPFMTAAASRRLPDGRSIIKSIPAFLGVGCLTVFSGGSAAASGRGGELFCLIAAVLYAAAICLTDRFSKTEDALLLGIVQVGTLGLLALSCSMLTEAPRLPRSGSVWLSVIVLSLVCTGFGFTLQPLAQRYVRAEQAGNFCALNPLFTMLTGIVFLGERFNAVELLGAALILCSISFDLWGKRIAVRFPKVG